MITGDWKTHDEIIWEYGIAEDFVPVYNKKDGKYYAFFTSGSDYATQRLGLATSVSPLEKFSAHGSISPLNMRLGSVIYPCKLTNWKWRLYHVVTTTDFYDWNTKRHIAVLESDDLVKWKGGLTLDIEEDGLLGQPCCHIVGDRFLMLATEIKKIAGGFEDVINAYFSEDGINFRPWKSNPLIIPKEGTNYSVAAGNPSFIADGKAIRIFFEGKTNDKVWRIFQAEWDMKSEAKVTNEPLISSPTANPCITKFGKRYYLYYGTLEKCTDCGVYKVRVIYQ